MEVRSIASSLHCATTVLILGLSWFSPITASVASCQSSITALQPLNNETVKVASIRTRLRISWGGGVAKQWRGSITAQNASFGNPAVLGFERESSGGLLAEQQQIMIRQNAPSSFEGIDIDVQGNADSKITIELFEAGSEMPIVHEFKLPQIAERNQVFALDQDNNRCSVVRSPGDKIEFATTRPHLIFEAGEAFEFGFRINDLGMSAIPDSCLIEIVKARSNEKPVYSGLVQLDSSKTGPKGMFNQSIDVPLIEGVYNLRFTASKRTSSLYRRRNPDREIQFVVLGKNQITKSNDLQQLIHEVTPGGLQTIDSQPLNQISRIIGIRNQQSIGHYQIVKDQAAVQLPVGGWQVIPISIKDVGEPHAIEIDYRANKPIALGLSILQPDESGQIPNFGFDSGLHVGQSLVAPESEKQTYRFMFWPNSKQIHLLIANRDQQHIAKYHSIRVYKNKHQIQRPDQFENAQLKSGRRSMMAFCEQPLFVDNFAVNGFSDPGLGQPINDWVSFYEGVVRMAQYLKDSGKTGAFINVLGEGSSLMPLGSIYPSCRYDSGVFSSLGHDPFRKDVVELIYRVFDREGLQFIPVLAFDERLAAIEFNSANSFENVVTDRRGQIAVGERLPVYNPLSSQIQNQVVDIVKDIVSRYRLRRNYQGLAVVCRPDTFTMLPGSQNAGYDLMTLKRFDSNVVAQPEDESLIKAEQMPEWLDWRADQMSKFYLRLKAAVSDSDSNSKLYLALVDVFKNDEIQGELSPSLSRPLDLGNAMLKLGFSAVLNEQKGLSIMRPQQLAPMHSLSAKKSEIAVKESEKWKSWFGNSTYTSSLFLHRSSWAHFEKLEGSAVVGQTSDPIMRLQHLEPAGDWSCERFATALLELDAKMIVDGGLLLNTSVDPRLRAFVDVFSQLPDIEFANVAHQNHRNDLHPIATRFAHEDGNTYLYCVNGSPWSIDVQVQSNLNALSVTLLSAMHQNETLNVDESGLITFKLNPFELFGIKTNSTNSFEFFDYKLPATASRDLNKTYYQMRSRVIASGNARPINVLADPSFENDDFSVGWTIGNQDREYIRKDQGGSESKSSLRISNSESNSVWVRSNKFKVPETGRLSVSVWLKTDDSTKQPPLRISIEGADPESNYYRFAKVGSLATGDSGNQLGEQWRRFAVHFTDLPLENLPGLRIGFDLMGPGQVSIDQVELFDRWMDDSDLKALTQMFASIGPLLERPEKMEQCRQILSGYWPQFLRDYVDQPATQNVQQAEIRVSERQPQQRSSMRRRFRRFVSPSIFQFR